MTCNEETYLVLRSIIEVKMNAIVKRWHDEERLNNTSDINHYSKDPQYQKNLNKMINIMSVI